MTVLEIFVSIVVGGLLALGGAAAAASAIRKFYLEMKEDRATKAAERRRVERDLRALAIVNKEAERRLEHSQMVKEAYEQNWPEEKKRLSKALSPHSWMGN